MILTRSPERIAGSVYGTVVVLGVVAAGAESATVDAWELDVLMIGTVIVLWIAHVYAHAIAQSIAAGTHLDEQALHELAAREVSIVLAAVGPGIALLLGAVGLMGDENAAWLALAIGTLTLVLQGLRYAKATALRGSQTLIVVAVNVTLALVIVGLKVWVES
ncbi:MAG: hypothetical protein ACRDLZ_02915 [Gaiellaceae bacterium]